MDQEFKAKWLTALTDGSYKHATGALATRHGHCCLGVVASLMGRTDLLDHGEYARSFLPDDLAETLGLSGHQPQLAILNDDEGGPKFPQTVIDYITEKL